MTARRLLRLYPPAWRERYGEELLEVVGQDSLTLQQGIDLVSGAIDAWLSADVRTATRAAGAPAPGGSTMTVRTLLCHSSGVRYTTRDSLIAAAVMIGLTAAFSALGLGLKYSGWTAASQIVLNVAFMASMTLSLPFWLMKGQPWKAQAVIVGGTLTLLIAIAALAPFI
jgi:hypothetical protein